jgi:hypothetical protein
LFIDHRFLHDCHHSTYVDSRMMRVTRTFHGDRTESPGTVHNACIIGLVPGMEGAKRLPLELRFCRSDL